LIAAVLATCFMAGFVHGKALPDGAKYASLPQPRGNASVPASRSIVLFFDWRRAELTRDAKAIVGKAVAAAKRDRSMRIELTAFSAPDEWTRDRLLASRRAASVKAEIVRLGFKGDIVTTGTPGGVGYSRRPQEFMRPGDAITVEVEGVGRMTNPVTQGW